jgi:hypothetical protein
MRTINKLQATGVQTFKVPLDAGGFAKITLTYRPVVQMWFLDFEYNTCKVRGLRLCKQINIIHQWREICPFGIAVLTDGAEPFLINDFSTGRVTLGILTAGEVAEYQAELVNRNA